ncbi:MAG: hypothetical protein KDN05_03725 [Verrucomicrobiae bacterium]|nr:hypothetical protein [Verrucomicrobiae bacterium]
MKQNRTLLGVKSPGDELEIRDFQRIRRVETIREGLFDGTAGQVMSEDREVLLDAWSGKTGDDHPVHVSYRFGELTIEVDLPTPKGGRQPLTVLRWKGRQVTASCSDLRTIFGPSEPIRISGISKNVSGATRSPDPLHHRTETMEAGNLPADHPPVAILRELEVHAWDPFDFPFGQDPVWGLAPDHPDRISVEAAIRLLITCDRIASDGVQSVREETPDCVVSDSELDTVKSYFERRVTAWADLIHSTGLIDHGWTTLRHQPNVPIVSSAVSALQHQVSSVSSRGVLAEWLFVPLESIYRQFACSMLVLPYATGLTPRLGDFVIKTAMEASYLGRWHAAVFGVGPSGEPTSKHPSIAWSLGDHWIDGLTELTMCFGYDGNRAACPAPTPGDLQAHLHQFARSVPDPSRIHVPSFYPAPAFLPWFEALCVTDGRIQYRHRRILRGLRPAFGCDDAEL